QPVPDPFHRPAHRNRRSVLADRAVIDSRRSERAVLHHHQVFRLNEFDGAVGIQFDGLLDLLEKNLPGRVRKLNALEGTNRDERSLRDVDDSIHGNQHHRVSKLRSEEGEALKISFGERLLAAVAGTALNDAAAIHDVDATAVLTRNQFDWVLLAVLTVNEAQVSVV